MKEETYPDFIQVGLDSLKEKYGYIEPIELDKPIKIHNGETEISDIYLWEGKPRVLFIASQEYTQFIEKDTMLYCGQYEKYIHNMTEDEIFSYCLIIMTSHHDARGLMPGQVPHLKFNFSKEFLLWENEIWGKIKSREAELGL